MEVPLKQTILHYIRSFVGVVLCTVISHLLIRYFLPGKMSGIRAFLHMTVPGILSIIYFMIEYYRYVKEIMIMYFEEMINENGGEQNVENDKIDNQDSDK